MPTSEDVSMDWYIPPHIDSVNAARDECVAFLGRHAVEGSDLEAAKLVCTELLTNAFKHARGPIWMSLVWSDVSPVLSVHDLGAGFELDPRMPEDPLAEGGRGLFIVSHMTKDLSRAAKRAGGSRVQATLPVQREVEQSHDPVAPPAGSLPGPGDADADGSISREPFLRALVVELARRVELENGPAESEATVASVGAGVGQRIEEEWRRARDLVGRLTPEQMAELFVDLKRAIEGDFYVIEVDERKIVLGNRRCPFGDVVRSAPSLCRMTSSVFGGIAARNSGVAAVQLEERIAVGDPGCRVVVWLGEPPEEATPFAHRYERPRVGAE